MTTHPKARPLTLCKAFVSLLLVALFLSACVTTRAIRLGTLIARPSIPWGEVVVYRSAD